MNVKLTLDQPADKDTARQYILSHDARAKKLRRMVKELLAELYCAAYPGAWYDTPPARWGRDELVSGVLDFEYPDIAAARATYYAAVSA